MEVKPGYKQTEVGVIPEEWNVKSLGSVLSEGRLGGNYANQDAEAELPLMKMGNLARGYFDLSKVQFITLGVRPEPAHRLVYGDVLFNTRNTLDLVGKVAIWRDELPVAYYNSNLMRLEFDPEQICSNEYANYSLNTEGAVSRLRALATGTTSVAAIYTRDLMKLQVLVPPPPEQRVIAEALSDVDGLLGELDRLIAKKRDLKQAAMQQLLTGQTRLPGFHGEWQTKQLGEITARLPKTTRKSSDGRLEGRYPFYTNSTQPVDKYLDDQDFDQEAIIVNTGGAAYFDYYDGAFAAMSDCMVLAAHVNTKWLFYLLKALETSINSTGFTGSGIKHLDKGYFFDLAVRLPESDEEQAAIARVLTDMDLELGALQTRREKNRALKQGMMQELLTGRIRLRPTEAHYA